VCHAAFLKENLVLNSFAVIIFLVIAMTYNISQSIPGIGLAGKSAIGAGMLVFLMLAAFASEVLHVLVVLVLIGLFGFGVVFPGPAHLTALAIAGPMLLLIVLGSIWQTRREAVMFVEAQRLKKESSELDTRKTTLPD
jgi:hypothetical protein